MRSDHTTPAHSAFARSALFVALVLPCTHVVALGQSTGTESARESVGEQLRVIRHEQRPVDPKHVPGWERFCADDVEKGGCDVIMQRLERKPVIGVLFSPDPGGGVRIAGVTPDGAGAGAGLKSGDRLLRIGGKTIEGDSADARVENARRMLQGIDVDTAVTLRYARGDRETEVAVKPKLDNRIMVFSGDGTMMRPDNNVIIRQLKGGAIDISTDRVEVESLHGAPDPGATGGPHVFRFTDTEAGFPDADRANVNRHIVRIECRKGDEECLKRAEAHVPFAIGEGPRIQMFKFDCKPGESCAGQQRLVEAFRWNGLNLASVDAQLGRYFGTDKGVLVLSAGPSLDPLQTGDVIQRLDGKAVETPRAVMDSLRDRPADSKVTVEYLRDRKPGTTQIKVPKAMAFPAIPSIPAAPPAPPKSPKAGLSPAAPASATVSTTQRRIVMVDSNGQVQTWEDNGNGMMPTTPRTPPTSPPTSPPVD